MKRIIQSALVVTAALALAACSDVTSTQVVGDTPAKLDPKKWNGAWSSGDGESFHARVKDADKGILEVAWLDVKDDAIEVNRVDVHVCTAGGWLWASFREKENQAYTIARVGEPDDHLLAWTPRSAPFIQRVKSGVLKGEVEKDDKGKETKSVRLAGLHDADLQAIRAGTWGDVFDWDKPALNLKHHRD